MNVNELDDKQLQDYLITIIKQSKNVNKVKREIEDEMLRRFEERKEGK